MHLRAVKERGGGQGGSRTLMPRWAAVSETAVSANCTTWPGAVLGQKNVSRRRGGQSSPLTPRMGLETGSMKRKTPSGRGRRGRWRDQRSAVCLSITLRESRIQAGGHKGPRGPFGLQAEMQVLAGRNHHVARVVRRPLLLVNTLIQLFLRQGGSRIAETCDVAAVPGQGSWATFRRCACS